MARSMTKKKRFEVFKRDEFACQYCGKTSPSVVLEVDHIVAVADGGSDELTNLITACFDCNRGKGAEPLSRRAVPEDLKVRQKLLKERIAQAEAYEELLKERRQAEESSIDEVIAVYETYIEGYTLLDKIRPSIRKFLRHLPKHSVIEAMELACARLGHKEKLSGRSPVFHYFCGICWRTIKEDK